ncbi:MAG: DUF2490 domain-containing protein [Bacteroidia bacterium]|nr:DUF2490 domain-containing protein [Bacteroidia bacterium]
MIIQVLRRGLSLHLLLLTTAALLSQTPGEAQPRTRDVTRQDLLWVRYNLNAQLPGAWRLMAEGEWRSFMNNFAPHQRLLRAQLTHQLGHGWSAGGGFTLFLQSPHNPEASIRFINPELRPHQALFYQQQTKGFTVTHRYQLEERFIRNQNSQGLLPGYQFNFRFRYQVQAEYPIVRDASGQPLLRARAGGEIHLNTGSPRIVYNVLDQYRILASLTWRLSPSLSWETAYVHWYQQRSTGYQFYERDIVRLTLLHTLQPRNKQKQ